MQKRQFVSSHELEDLVKDKLNSNAFQYYRSGANEELTLKDNIEAFKKIKLNPRVLRDVSKINLETTILGHRISMPLGVAPTAMLKLVTEEGEKIPAAVAFEMNLPYTLSTLSTTGIKQVAEANQTGLRFMQLYIQKDRQLTKSLVKQAEQNGFKAIVLTVDAPVLGKREADERQKFQLPDNLQLQILLDIANGQNKHIIKVKDDQGSGLKKLFGDELDQSLTWGDVMWLKTITHLPIVVKGIQSWQDALLAKQHGVAAVWVSNHGGRQLDTVRATIDVLPEIVEVLKESNIEVYVDGGIRRGQDVFKCLALGARCVFIGRPVIYATAFDKKDGVTNMFQIFKSELTQTMVLSGVTQISDINQSYIVKASIPKPNL